MATDFDSYAKNTLKNLKINSATDFDFYVKNILKTFKILDIPYFASKGVDDWQNLFAGADLNESVYICIADYFIRTLGHGDMCIFKGNNNEVKGVIISEVSPKFLSIIKEIQMLYSAKYKTIKLLESNKYAFYFYK